MPSRTPRVRLRPGKAGAVALFEGGDDARGMEVVIEAEDGGL